VTFFRSNRVMQRLATFAIGWAILAGSVALACTIPVFRFALERWAADSFLVVVYSQGDLTSEQQHALAELAERSTDVGGTLNIEIFRYNLAAPPEKRYDLQPPPADQSLPCVEIRSRLDFAHTALRWRGSFAEAIDQPGLFDSPARQEIVRRILGGHSVVWLLIAPADQTADLNAQLQDKLDTVAKTLTLPQGIGLPGSELYSEIPLEVRHSSLAIAHNDSQEQHFLKLLASSAKHFRAGEAYVVPIFGRCRALEVIPHAEIDQIAIEDIANFLGNACSCQVKQANPGFDLLASVNWEDRLFNGVVPQPLAAHILPNSRENLSTPPSQPEYVSIPSGTIASAAAPQSTPDHSANDFHKLLLIAAACLLSGGILRCVLPRRY
jgi:hypothetical protein